MYDLEAREGARFSTVSNHSGQVQTFRLRSLKVSNSATTLTEGYEDAPDASYLRFSEMSSFFRHTEQRKCECILTSSQRTEYCGKRFMFVIHAYVGWRKSQCRGLFESLRLDQIER